MARTIWLCIALVVIASGCSATADDSPSATASTAATETATASPTLEKPTSTVTATSASTATAAVPTATPTGAPTPTTPVADWGNSEIYVMNPDGSNQRRLTDDLGYQSQPSWSPDGTRIALTVLHDARNPIQGTVIAVMDADGSNSRTLTSGPDDGPVWSPDSEWIAFTSSRDGHNEIYVVHVDGSDERRLTTSEERGFGNSQPTWSPDSTSIVYVSYVNNLMQLMVMDADGDNQRPLRASDSADFDPAWSPNGSQIAFVSSLNYGPNQIHVMNADGSNVRNLSNNELNQYEPAWSPDGSTIAFTRLDAVNDDVWIMNADGSNVRQLTTAPHSDNAPAWSPDGALIAFTSNRDGGQPIECSWGTIGDLAPIYSMETMTWMAHQVAVGTVVEQLPPAFGEPLNPEFQPSLDIYSDYLFEIEQQFRGLPADVVRIRELGGTIGDCVQTYEPLVPLEVGQRVLIFLTENDQADGLPPAYYVTGGPQGHFVIGSDDTINNDLDPERDPQRMTLDDVLMLVIETLGGEPPPDAFHPVPVEDAPPVLP